MRKNISVFGGILFCTILISCNKEEAPITVSSAMFVHASPGTPSFQVFVDTIGPLNNSTIAYGAGSGYLGMLPGTRGFSLEDRTVTPKSIFAQFQGEMEAGKFYSYFLYDTSDATTKKAKILRLVDPLTVPASGTIGIRFLHLAPKQGALDVTIVRGTQFDSSSTSTQKLAFIPTDSITLQNNNYVGDNPDLTKLAQFTTSSGSTAGGVFKAATINNVPAASKNNRYIIKLKTAGTQTVLVTSAVTTFLEGKLYTLFARGTVKAQPLALSIITHY